MSGPARRFGAHIALVLYALLGCSLHRVAGTAPRSDAPVPAPEFGEEGVARIGDRIIRLEELDAWIKDALFHERADSFPGGVRAYRSQALDQMIDELVLAQEAARLGKTPDELIAEAVPQSPEITEEDVEAFSEQFVQTLPEGASGVLGPLLSQPMMRDLLRESKVGKARREYLNQLRRKAGVAVMPAYSAPHPRSAQ
jgi:hypothetical protein